METNFKQNQNNVKVIFSFQLAQILIRKGCKIVDIDKNRKFTDKIVFYFEQTNKLEQIIDNYQNLFLTEAKSEKSKTNEANIEIKANTEMKTEEIKTEETGNGEDRK